MKRFAFIFARGGSKGLPHKNILPFCGKPLIAWTIEQAISVKKFDKVIVSTDSNEIANVAKDFGAEVPFLRPEILAKDDSPEWLSWQHALSHYKLTNNFPNIMVSLPSTAPLRSIDDIHSCLELFESSNADVVITATQARRSPFFNMLKANQEGFMEPLMKSDINIFRRQDAPITFDMTTVAYVVKPQFVLENSGIFAGKVKALIVPESRAVDIDTEFDFQFAEFIHRRKSNAHN